MDELNLFKYEQDRRNHLYRLWNQMSSGSYMPLPVLLVEIPKKGGGLRPLGIPMVTDRIAQTTVTMILEPMLDKLFHKDSYCYRPNKSAKDAIGSARARCWKHDWVLDVDIKGFFDNIPHDLLMKAVLRHTESKWILLYIERWLKAPVQQTDGTLAERTKGTPQGAVISPLLANLFLHYCMDEWLRLNYPSCPFERYADDSVIHCKTEAQAMDLQLRLSERLKACGLEMHPEKTRIVYCGKANPIMTPTFIAFDFLGYTFRRRKAKNKQGEYFRSFLPAISNKAKVAIRDKMRTWQLHRRGGSDLKGLASMINPVLRGWINYYGAFYKTELYGVLQHMNSLLARWAMRKYKRLRRRKIKATRWVSEISERNPHLFEHWRIGIRPLGWIITAV